MVIGSEVTSSGRAHEAGVLANHGTDFWQSTLTQTKTETQAGRPRSHVFFFQGPQRVKFFSHVSFQEAPFLTLLTLGPTYNVDPETIWLLIYRFLLHMYLSLFV